MPSRLACCVVALGLALAFPAPAPAQQAAVPRASLDRLVDSLTAVRQFGEVALSPDGKSVAWVEDVRDKNGAPTEHSAIRVASLAEPGASPRRLSAGAGEGCNERGLAWSPDSSQLAFLSDKEKAGQLQVYIVPVAGGVAKKRTTLIGDLAGPRFSPDGKQLAFLFTENAPRAHGPTQAGVPDAGVVEEKVYEQRLAVIDLATGGVRLVSPDDLYVYEYDWSPDGARCVLSAAHGSGDNNWYLARLYAVAIASGALKEVHKPPLQIAEPRWSPDGKEIAFIGGLMSDEGATGGEVFAVPATGGPARNLTPGLKASAASLVWLASGKLRFTEHLDGGSGLAEVDPADGNVTTLWSGPESVAGEGGLFRISQSRDGRVAALVRQSFAAPPEVWAGPLGAWKAITRLNARARPAWGEAKSLHWKSDAFTVQGWLLYPRDFDPRQRYPMVVSIHGGPAWARRPSWPHAAFDLAALAAEGYFVFFPNPRGSLGQGEAFTRANVKDFGHGDLRDVLAGVDEAQKTAPIDRDRLGLGGWSYGGYLTMWAVTQTNRFRSAVAGAGIANWQSYYGQNGIDQWMIPYFGASVYDDPEVYAKSSPITFIKRVQTPTLVLVGDRDLECPPPQSYEFWHALKTLKVRTQLVVYPGEGHGFAKPENRRDVLRRTLAWFDRDLKGEGASAGAPGAGDK